ncbi:response regulator [Suttonella ornithocola]|uniref:Transcriptional regulatory protein CreB n=1 Tax=Suttonella ornithocola TaxID=279832 RepID=A0A380MPY6_9GAMM|nr:response regulator [Suttonella ornithocola]SUO94126.1 Transcriptional regulatory protein CreB [Suttonella ornithocola]
MNAILIIEDEIEIAELISFALKREGFCVDYCHSAQTGLQLLEQLHPSLLILDVGLPDTDGLTFLKNLRAKDFTLPVIMLTARNDEIDRILGLELGADDYVGKPFSPRELTARVKAVLKRSQLISSHLPVKILQMHSDRQQITYQEKILPLTLAEYRLLTVLLAHPKRVFSREQLLTSIFTSNHPSDARTIDTHIKSLRKKLREAGADAALIQTHRGMGYSYQEPN